MSESEIRRDLPFAIEPLQAYLRERIDGVQGNLQLVRFKGGQSNPTFLLESSTHRYVLRAKPAPVAELLPSAHAIEREYRVQAALAGSEVPVAHMHCLCEDESVIGRAFYVMQHVEGRVFWDQALPDSSRSERGALYDEFNRVISALHRVDPEAIGLGDFGKHGDYMARQIRRWSKQFEASRTIPIAAMDRLLEWLPAHLPADDTAVAIVHGDCRLDNLIFHPTEPRILAVIDWELSTLGNPQADFAYHMMSRHIPRGAMRGLGDVDVEALGIPSEASYIADYERRSGRRVSGDWNYYLAYNLFRLAAICQGIAKRVDEGTASNAQAAETGAMAAPLAELGWQFARKAGARA
ncbi:MAG: phosphotransferase [Dokdonella sp.]|uniref:phosphotransferase n=1 Tax=Dokdonella sp. TaxID=2291710 RepID=UPI002BAFBFA7|nr:phosphotransferase [Dokdonella sp.]HOX72676.1 phosphotransferase [Dokdonella sp.]HPG94210.1 phosphotransferase [Dokdonella sp.]HPN78149.1 phosphotransferase [Dokdonella sp.]